MRLHPAEIDLTLDRMHRLLDALGNPERQLPPVIHIAGTNGKGSVQAMLRAGLEGAGGRVHAYTSPHLVRFHERIRLAGADISEEALCAVLDEVIEANAGEEITFFEATTAAAFVAMARTPADWCLLEVGLGGRLDATNVVDAPALCVITPVALDHQEFLGETLGEIAGEKAGIVKRDVRAVVARQAEAAEEVIEQVAARVGAPLLVEGQHWHAQPERGRLVVQDETGLADVPLPVLRGPHQMANAGVAVVALRALGQGDAALEAAMRRAEWPARMQRLEEREGLEIWLDGGHNPAAAEVLAAGLGELPERETVLVVAMLANRAPEAFLTPLAKQAQALVAVPIPDEPKAHSPETIVRAAERLGLAARAAPGLDTALAEVAREHPGARVVICGSLYLAGAVLGGRA
ncbi:bifunctional folylpolyglutamate synthase/dihydrofolate synthase [Vannielia litorea]|uniref:bifunctional folylpolyglutamate synthase/dihydrofolate synthase n=1 Tax=Vannielia litorea TaxID=1217970 RepID=UPI001C97FB9B|nr:folylpolyglutamate synthase/dihydrofolate synthase family protein [Vannielia litorea]MBY6049917.1 bifunctional folylpolyglutamate synthase/dihydrofolate synthase [Vannielia litorea]MBY6077331.1 bifunctional folylpolyglutamate synthase/dihydrofolate synthase [Vannielia litorea]